MARCAAWVEEDQALIWQDIVSLPLWPRACPCSSTLFPMLAHTPLPVLVHTIIPTFTHHHHHHHALSSSSSSSSPSSCTSSSHSSSHAGIQGCWVDADATDSRLDWFCDECWHL